MSRSCLWPTIFVSVARSDPSASARMPSVADTRSGTRPASVNEANSTSRTPSVALGMNRAASSSASRVLPTPPGPMRVSKGVRSSKLCSSVSSRVRPMKLLSWRGRLSCAVDGSTACRSTRSSASARAFQATVRLALDRIDVSARNPRERMVAIDELTDSIVCRAGCCSTHASMRSASGKTLVVFGSSRAWPSIKVRVSSRKVAS